MESNTSIGTVFNNGGVFITDGKFNGSQITGTLNSREGNYHGEKMKILFLASDPSNAARLRLAQEYRDIEEKLRLARQREKFDLESRGAVRPGDITQAILDFEPNIVHFSGHGTPQGELCFEDNEGKGKVVSTEALSSLFKVMPDRIICVVLNACYSEAQADAIVRHIPYVVGMKKAIGDKAAIAFSLGFYKALGAGRSVPNAYEIGLVEMQLEGIAEHLTPVLKKSLFPLWQRLVQLAAKTQQMGPVIITGTLDMGRVPGNYPTDVPLGSDIRFEVPLDRPGHLLLLEKGTSGQVYCLCPSSFAPQPVLPAGIVSLPQPTALRDSFPITGNPGVEELVAILTDDIPLLSWLPNARQEAKQLSAENLTELLDYVQQNRTCQILSSQFTITLS